MRKATSWRDSVDYVASSRLDRRELLKAMGIGAGAIAGESLFTSVAGRGRVVAQTPGMDMTGLTAAQAAAAIRNGDLSAEAYAETLIAQSAARRQLNAFISEDPDALLEAARAADERRRAGARVGPLHGVPLVLKDNIDTVDLPTTGGSSGGTGAAIGARIAPAGLGSDTGGSVRIPAALCGVTGLRPSSGQYPGAGIVPISSTNDTPGPLARDVADLALLDGVITGDDAPLPTLPLSDLRLAVHREHFWEDLDPQTAEVMTIALNALSDAGVELVEAGIAGFRELRDALGFAARQEVRAELVRYLDQSGSGVDIETLVGQIGSPDVRAFVDEIFDGPAISDTEYREFLEVHRPRYQAAYAEYFSANRVDAMIFPATPLPARPIGHDDTVELNGRQAPTFPSFARNTAPASGAGIPGLVIPAGLTEDGLPVGLEIDGPVLSDRRLLGIGLAIETLLPALPSPNAPG